MAIRKSPSIVAELTLSYKRTTMITTKTNGDITGRRRIT